jgi:hypothetical protein
MVSRFVLDSGCIYIHVDGLTKSNRHHDAVMLY